MTKRSILNKRYEISRNDHIRLTDIAQAMMTHGHPDMREYGVALANIAEGAVEVDSND